MKRPKLRKGSKRMSCHKRYKIQKKVKEHYRKVKKAAKKAGHRKPKKDLSIPNDAPFKEDILREAELRKQRREELKAAQKLERQKEVAKKRKLKDKTETEQKEKKETKTDTKSRKTAATSSVKSLCREVNKVIEASHVVLEVLDARDPLGSRCLQAEQAVLQSPDKKLLLVLNKIDLVPKGITEEWLHMLNQEIPTIAFKCSTQVQEKNLPGTVPKARLGCIDISKGTVCYGAETLMRVLHRLHQLNPSANEGTKVGLIGFSNVGKSSLINSLRQSRACNVGSLKGTTRLMQEVNIDKKIKMIDSPSLVVSADNPPVTLVMRSIFQKENEDVLNSVQVILSQCDKRQTMFKYNIPDFQTSLEFLDLFGRRRGQVKKGGVTDLQATARIFLNEWMGARLSYYTLPPVSFNTHISKEQISALRKGLNLNGLNEDIKKLTKALKCPSSASSIPFQFSQMTNGVLDEAELEENPEPEEQEFEEEDESENNDQIDEKESSKLKSLTNQTVEAKELASKSVRLDKSEEEPADAYDFSTDFN